ncbi:MAG: hypothetical protein JRG91_08160 [Deltaproteobacteria bacterium]|nr:hypothetical protein [Deltaproteobacteria bacterium]
MIGKLLDRYMWVVDLVIIAVFAAFLAAGVDHFLTGMIDGLIRGVVADPAQEKKPGGRLARLTAGLRSSRDDGFIPVDGTDILRRNIFDSITGPLDGVEDMAEQFFGMDSEETVTLEDGSMLPLCTTPLSLQACYASEEYPDFSFVAVKKEKETRLLHVGQTIDNYTVSLITWRYAFLSQPGGQQCYLDLWREQILPPALANADGNKPMTAQQKKAAGGKKKGAADFQSMLNKSIKDISPNEKDIDRELIEYLVDNKQMLMQSGRVLPNVEGDTINGFKVYGIRKTSLWGKLGIHNGDVVLSVNDTPMDGPDKAYEAFANLQGTDTMAVQVLRHGKPQSFTYNIK